MRDTYIYIQEFDDGSIRYGITNNLERRMREHQSSFGDTFSWSLMVKYPVKLSTAKTIEALLIQQAFDDKVECINNKVENKRYLFENRDKLDSCQVCEDIGCSIDGSYIDGLIQEHRDNYLQQKKEYNKEYREANRDKIAQYNKEYNQANKDKIAQQKKEWYEANRDKHAQQMKEYRKANKDKIAQQMKEYYQANKDKHAQQKKEYRKAKREYWNVKAIEAGYIDRFDVAKTLKIEQKKIDWDNLPAYK